MRRSVRVAGLILMLVMGWVLSACAAAPTPTPTAKPVAAAATPTKAAAAAPSPTPELIKWVGGKLQPLPDGFPNKALTMVGAEAGSTTDIFMRELAKATQPFSPVPLVVYNLGGGLGAQFAYIREQSGAKEGYFTSAGSGSILASVYLRDLGFTMKDVQPVILPNTDGTILAVKADSPWKTLKEFTDYAKANPGKVRIGGTSPDSWNTVIAYWLADEAKIDVIVATHEGSGEAVLTLLGGGIEAASVSVPATAQHLAAGTVRLLATANTKRLETNPDVPTYKEAGFNIVYDHFRGLITPAEVAATRVEWLYALYRKGAETPGFAEWTKKVSGFPLYQMTPKEAKEYFAKLDITANTITAKLGIQYKKK